MGTTDRKTRNQLLQENDELKARLSEAEETLRAIHDGEVDAVVVSGARGDQVYSLAGAESVYRLVVETMKETALTVAPDGTVLFCNTRFGELIKRPLEQIVGRRLASFLAPGGLVSAESMMSCGEEHQAKRRVVFAASDGSAVPALVSSSLLKQPNGVSICIVATDLTELEQSAETLRQLRRQQEELEAKNTALEDAEEALRVQNDELAGSERRFRAFFDTAAVGTSEMDLKGRLTRVNDRYCHITGFTREELLGLTAADLAHPDDRAQDQQNLVAYLEGRVPEYDAEKRYVRKDGSVIWVHVTEAMIRDSAGRPLHSAGVIRDVTERRRRDEQIRLMNESLEQRVAERTAQLQAANRTLRMISQCNEVLVRADDELSLARDVCRIIQSGGYRMVWVGYALPDADRTIRPIASAGFEDGYLEHSRFSWADNELGRGPTGTAIRTGTVRACDDFLADPSLSPWREEALERGYRSSASLPLRSAGQVFGVITIYADTPRFFDAEQVGVLSELADDLALGITALRSRSERDRARKLAEERAMQLRALAMRLVQAEHGERRRIANLLHDHLQQLLVGAKYNLAIAKTGVKSHSALPVLRKVTKILDQAIKAARSLTGELSPPVLHENGLAVGLEWLGGQMLEKHGVDVEISADRDAEPASEVVRLFLFGAVRELLLNVVKHAGVRRARVDLRRASSDQVAVSVSDEGVGFDAASIERSGAARGSFGLFSLRERLDHIGGRMEMDSAPGHGSRVTIVVPAGTPAPAADESGLVEAESAVHAAVSITAAATAPAGRGKIRVLLADDHQVMRQALARLLNDRPDISVVGEAEDGVEAVELTRQLRPDVIVMDVSMPRMDGISATRTISSEFPNIQVIGLSMHDAPDAADVMRLAGAADYLSKSVSPAALVAAVRRAMAAGQQAAGPANPPRSKRPARAKPVGRGTPQARRRS